MSLYGWQPETATGPGDPTGWSDSPATERGDGVGRRLSLAILAAAAASGEERRGRLVRIDLGCGPCEANRAKRVAPLGRSAYAG
jgi:hypothetical protein